MRACQVLRPRRVAQVLALALLDILPSTTQTASAPGISFLSRLNGCPARSPADASPKSSRMPAHGSGPMWFAIPSSQWTCTTYSLPVSRRTCVKTRKIEKSRECFFLDQLKSDSLGNVCATIGDSDERFFCRQRARLSFYTAKIQ